MARAEAKAVPEGDLVARVLAGETRALARMITYAETGDEAARPLLAEVYRHGGRAHLVGITGVPGSGKSTLVRALAQALRADKRTVGVVAVDPSSPFSGGAILGDRIRMAELAGDDGIFIRSMASRGVLGGLAHATLDAVDVLDAGGFDVVMIETVGVGQDEVDIVRVADTTVVVSAPGLGDDIQAIKAGVLEIADIHAVSKCDRADANRTVTDLKHMLTLGLKPGAGWRVPVLRTSAHSGDGVAELLAKIDGHRAYLVEHGELEARRRRSAEARVVKIAEEIVRRRYARHGDGGATRSLVERVSARELDPHGAALQLLDALNRGGP
ncbi:MAG TPA: methylmalonyl Co-A mutase-associated GTPase MeaB [Alphaproteobacteria bacterium]